MTLNTIMNQINAGSVVSVVVLVSALVEITPVKFSPLAWLGKRINTETNKRLDELEKRLDAVDGKLDEHVAQSYRNKIFDAQKKLLAGHVFTIEEFDEIIDACSKYEQYCKDNGVPNDKCKLAIGYLHHVYKQCQDNRSFANLPVLQGDV